MKKIALVICLIALLVGVGTFVGLAVAQSPPTPTPTPPPTQTPTPTPTPVPTPHGVLILSPTSGPPGTEVMLSGSEIPPIYTSWDEIPASGITFAGMPWNISPIHIDTYGNWNTMLKVPPDAPSGPALVVATSTVRGRYWIASFTVTPTCGCLPAGFHADYALRQKSTGQIRDTGIDASSNPPPTSPGGWDVIQILVKE